MKRGATRRLVAAGALALAALAAVPAAPADGAWREVGRFVSVCEYSHESMDDPIVFPRKPGAAHHHQFFGNRSTNARSTPRKLRRHRRTTCQPAGDRSAYWAPALHSNDTAIRPMALNAYYSSHGKDPRTIQPPPKGLEVIAGEAEAASAQPQRVTYWTCVSGTVTDALGYMFGSTVPGPFCPRGASVVLNVDFPDCWDGVNVDTPDHNSHLAYPAFRPIAQEWKVCPASHPVPIPALNLKILYPKSGVPAGAELSSGGIYSAHMDFMDGWRRKDLVALVENCINRAINCKRPRSMPAG